MLTWREFDEQQPELAAAGRGLLYQHGVGLAFLATIRGDGRPRRHPVCPRFGSGRCVAFTLPSPKQTDLRRDGWYSMHSFPCPDNEDAFYVSGRARLVSDCDVRRFLVSRFVDHR